MWGVCSAKAARVAPRGFTLIELLISMGIFSVISGFVLVNFRSGSRKDELRLAADQVSAILRDVVARATAGTSVAVCVANATATVLPQGATTCANGGVLVTQVPPGWGVAFGVGTPSALTLFADINNNLQVDAGEVYSVERFSASGLVAASAATPNGTQTAVVATLPNPDITIAGNPAETEATLSLTHTVDGGSRTVHFNRVSRRITVTEP